ncbi:transglycosylase domain-containing protein [Actinotalea sp. C106]|uniref:transglycosylase domain-containing protein n=1 Tax=Actinotalea sp. C106 TaxID=2908644 RepID=UPI0020294950|nr:transglycosylase domain-containing protein [Actinotalea sp. C106]
MVSSASSRSGQGRQINVLQAVALLGAFVIMAVLGGVLAAGLVMPAVATTSTLTETSVQLFDDLPEELEEVPLSEKSTVVAADGTVLAEFFHEDRIVVGLDDISQSMKDAVIATEDRRFYEHGGIDPTGMARALVNNAMSDDVEGASTLTQQYVKNALIQAAQASDDDAEVQAAIAAARETEGAAGYARKLEEAKLAIALEKRISKDEILERYLNIAQFGLSVYGVEAAAQHFFSVPASELTYLQAATIAGVTQSPSALDPERNPEASQAKRDLVLRNMRQEGYVTQEELQAGLDTPIAESLNIGDVKLGCVEANSVSHAGYFCDYVTKVIASDATFGETRADRVNRLLRGGLTITTTLDPDLQLIADTEVKNGIPVDDPSGVASAISVVEPGTGHILAMAQNRVYNSSLETGPGETAVNYNTDSAYGSSKGFAPGSTFKPFTLVQWLKDGRSLNEVIDGRLKPLNENMFTACGAPGVNREWNPGNAEGSGGFMTVQDATRNSVNSGYFEMATQLDLCNVMDTATSMGVHKPDGEPFSPYPANVIGSDSVAPLTMASAFATFASGGTYCEPIAITEVLDTNGEPLPVPEANCREVLSPEIAAGMNHALGQVWTGTGRAIGALDRPSAGKTGTTSRNEYTWFVGYTPQMAGAVWVGFPDAMRPVQFMTVGGTYRDYMYGSSIAGPTWKRFMEQAHAGLPVEGFTPINDRLLYGERIAIPSVSGQSVDAARQTLVTRGFNAVVSADPVYSSAPAGTVAYTTPGSGSSATRGSVVTIVPSRGPEPQPEPQPEPEPENGGGENGNSPDDRDED